MNGTCDAVHHVEHSKTWKRTGNVQEEYKGIPADPTMSVTVRQQATTVSARRRVVLNLGDGMLLTFVFWLLAFRFCFLFFVVDFQVSQVFAVLDAYPHARAIRDILLNDYVEQVVARVLGPERVLWFLRECLVLGGHEYYRANVAEGKHWQDLWSGWVAPKKSKKQRGRGGASSAPPTDDSDTSLTGQYVKPTSPETPEPPSLTKVGKQFWDVPEL